MTPAKVRTVATACLVICLALVVYGLMLGFHIEGTPQAVADAEKGQSIGIPAAAAALAAVVALIGAGRQWALGFLAVAVLLGALAIVLAVTR